MFFDRLVRPAYKEIYKDSRLLSSRKKLAVLYILADATFLTQILPFLFLGGFFNNQSKKIVANFPSRTDTFLLG